MAYPGFFRRKVLEYKVKHNLTIQATADYFKIGTASIVRWAHKPEPQKTRYRKPTKLPDKVMLQDIEDYPDDYQFEIAQRLGVTPMGICHALKRLKITRKKNSVTSQSRSRKARIL